MIFIQIGAVFYENDAWWYMQIICFLIVIIINGKALWLDVKKIYQMKYGDRR